MEIKLSSMFHIYFSQSIPSITDWIQAIGVLLSVIGLSVTLWFQRETLQDQQEITRIEQKNFRFKFLPRLQLSTLGYNKLRQKRQLIFQIAILENHIQQISFENYFPENYKISLPVLVNGVILPAGLKMKFTIEFELEDVFIEIEEYSGDAIWMYYVDEIGNSYYQRIIYKGGSNIFLEPAKLIEENNN